MKQSLLEKYDIQAPRYTSYPPVPYWEKAPCEQEWFSHLSQTFSEKGNTMDVYIHIPFCQSICHYCGCNRIASSNHDLMAQYVSSVLKEWDLYKKRLGNFEVASIHLGGGTPTWPPVYLLDSLLDGISKNSCVGSVEIDPRVTTKEHLEGLFRKGFRRVSMGIQDFHPEVQKKMGRIQGVDIVQSIVQLSRQIGFEELNFDLIFGLPAQTEESLTWTFQKVIELRPETIAYYSFAYVPHFAKNQLAINQEDIPQGASKRKLYERGRELLFKNGYIEIGMDHFALPHSSLALALKNKNLTRSFMGYTVRKAPVLIGLGASSISSSSLSFIQNQKEISAYMTEVSAGHLGIMKGHIQTEDDLLTETIIQGIMCRGEAELVQREGFDLSSFIEDGLIQLYGTTLKVTEKGRPFLRNIALAFDQRAKKGSTQGFSRTI